MKKIQALLLVAMVLALTACNKKVVKVQSPIVIESVRASSPLLTATASTHSVSLSWIQGTCNNCSVTGNNVYRSQTNGSGYVKIATLSPATSYTDNSLAASTTFYYVVTSTCSACTGAKESIFSNQSTATTPEDLTSPNPPTNLTNGTITQNKVPLIWQGPVPQVGVTIVSYTVWKGTKPTLPNPSKVALVKTLSYTDTCTKKPCYYEIKVNAKVNGKALTSGPSNIVGVL